MTDVLTYLFDREQIRDCLARVARGEDRRDAELITGAYWPEALDDHGVSAGTLAEYLEWVVPGSPSIPDTLHTLGQSVIQVEGTAAVAETHVTAYHRIDTGDGEIDVVLGGRYLDRLEKRADEWRIIHRTMLYDWLRDFGTSVDWSQGVLGMPFRADHYVGRAHGDHSAKGFFS